MCVVVCGVFFFKQKTAYEMRISDWSSDVCSSDLGGFEGEDLVDDRLDRPALDQRGDLAQLIAIRAHEEERVIHAAGPGFAANGRAPEPQHDAQNEVEALRACEVGIGRRGNRSEEHTSELQSLMRISYAFFCLKKNT